MSRSFTHLGVLVLLAGLLAGCSGDDESDDTTTSTTAAPVTSIATTQGPTTTLVVPPGGDTTTTTTTTTPVSLGGVEFPAYTITERIEAAEGDTLVILIDPDFDDALTDIDIQSLLSEVVDNFAPVNTAFVVDSSEAAAIVLLEQFTQEQIDELSDHYLARLEDGFRIIFEGPFEDLQPLLISS